VLKLAHVPFVLTVYVVSNALQQEIINAVNA
jgi:hypothetical protein